MCNTPEDLDLKGIDTVAIDIETYDPNLKTKGLGAIRNDGFIEVLSGLELDDTIVAEGLKKVNPKGKIKPITK